MILVAPLFGLIACCLSVILFEVVYGALRATALRIPKAPACCAWWCFVILSCLPCGIIAFIFNVPLFGIAGISHYSLAEGKETVISVQEVARNLPATLRNSAARIRPFMK